MAKMDILDKKYELKKFLRLIFEKVDFEEEEIGVRLLNKEKEINIAKKFDDIDKLIDWVLNHYKIYEVNAYFYLCTFKKNSESFEEKDIAYRYCLACDFDRKDFASLDVDKAIKLYKNNTKLSYHAIVDTSGGYHIYSCIERTNDFETINSILNKFKNAVNCDTNALSLNQMLRLPCTFNTKHDKSFVNPFYTQNKNDNDFKRYDINSLYNLIFNTQLTLTGDRGIPLCLQNMIDNGSVEGNRHNDLLNIVTYYRNVENKTIDEIWNIVEEWAIKSNYFKQAKKDFKDCFAKKKYFFDCKECNDKDVCNFLHKNKIVGEWDFDENFDVNEYGLNSLNRGVKYMNEKELLISNILYNYRDKYENGMTRDEITKELTYRRSQPRGLAKRQIGGVLNGLIEKGYVELIKGNARLKIKERFKLTSKFYDIKDEEKIKISYFATLSCIWKIITPSELKLYYVMRVIHHKRELQNKETYQGSLLCITQKDLAKEYKKMGGGTNDKDNVGKMVRNLVDSKIISIEDVRKSKEGYEYNVYRLNS